MGAPKTLPANFFDQKPPDTLPADFFDRQESQQRPGATERFVGSFARTLGAPEKMSDVVTGPAYALRHPIDSANLVAGSMAESHQNLWDKAYQLQHSPGIANKLKGTLYGVYSMIPAVGPPLAHAGEQMESGDIAGGLGTTTAIAAPVAAPKVLPAVSEAVKAPLRAAGKKIGPALAETSLGVRITDRLHGKTPGQAVIEETTANRPEVIAKQANDKAAALTKELETAAANSPRPASVNSAVQMLNDEAVRAAKQNNPELLKKINQLKNRVTIDMNGQPFPAQVRPDKVLALKRGIDDLITTWGPQENASAVSGVTKRLYGMLDQELERTVPEAKVLNPRIANMITVAKRAEMRAAGPDTTARVVNRLATHTGALTGAGVGLLYGGPIGGVAGFVLPELASNPAVQMRVARFLGGDRTITFTPAQINKLPPKVAIMVMNAQNDARYKRD